MKTLKNYWVTLEPLLLDHHDELVAAASDGELWKLAPITSIPVPDKMKAYIENALAMTKLGQQQAFAIRRNSDGKIVGSTRFYEIASEHRRRSIGWTWYSKSAQRTAVNTATKLLLLSHAFRELNCIAVAFHTHVDNSASRAAILRLGATEEGILRNHRILADGSLRDTVCFSILNREWGGVLKGLLDALLPDFTRIVETYLSAQHYDQESLKESLIRNADREWPSAFKAEYKIFLEHDDAVSPYQFMCLSDNEFDTVEEFNRFKRTLWLFLFEDGPGVW